jgi:hypothetical protein
LVYDLANGYAAASARVEECFVNQNYFYNLERRWPGSAF